MDPQLTWNLYRDVTQLFDYPFMVNAYRAGTIVAVPAAIIGWFMVLRRQTFAGHTFALVSFPGAAGAILIGVSATYGFFAFSICAALVIAASSRSGRGGYSEESAVIGTVQALGLAFGFLFVSLSHRNVSGAQALLFGSFVGITNDQVIQLLVGGLIVLAIVGFMWRPLLFASIDPDVAAARGVPVQVLAVLFLPRLAVVSPPTASSTPGAAGFCVSVASPGPAKIVFPARRLSSLSG